VCSVGVRKTASRVPGWAPQVTPTRYPVVSPRWCNCSGVTASAGTPAWPGGRGLLDAPLADQPGAGDLGDAHGAKTVGQQPGAQPAQARALGPRPGGGARLGEDLDVGVV